MRRASLVRDALFRVCYQFLHLFNNTVSSKSKNQIDSTKRGEKQILHFEWFGTPLIFITREFGEWERGSFVRCVCVERFHSGAAAQMAIKVALRATFHRFFLRSLNRSSSTLTSIQFENPNWLNCTSKLNSGQIKQTYNYRHSAAFTVLITSTCISFYGCNFIYLLLFTWRRAPAVAINKREYFPRANTATHITECYILNCLSSSHCIIDIFSAAK